MSFATTQNQIAVGVCVGDYNNDGYEDLFVTYYGQNKLYRNNGNGTFTDVTARAGLLHEGTRFGTGCTFLDYNRDGMLDLFVGNYLDQDISILKVNGTGITDTGKRFKLPGHPASVRMSTH